MNVLEESLYDALAGNAPLLAVVSTRIYRQTAPPGAVYPLVLFGLNAGGDENTTSVDSLDVRYAVRGVSEVSTDQAGDVDDLIRTVLHKTALTVTGWSNFWTTRGAEIRLTEIDPSGKRFYHAGAIYRIRLDKT